MYGPALILALPLGVGLGALIGSTFTWTGWGSPGAFVGGGAVVGGVIAMLGAGGALVAVHRAARRGDRAVTAAAVKGTTVGAASFWVLLLTYVAVIAGPSVLLALVPALVLGSLATAVAAGACAALLAGCRALHRRRDPAPLAHGAG